MRTANVQAIEREGSGRRRWLRPDEFAEQLSARLDGAVSASLVRRWLRNGKLRGRKLGGGRWRVLASEVERLALEELERPKARKRQAEHGDTAPGRPANTSVHLNRSVRNTRDIVGEIVCEVPSYVYRNRCIMLVQKHDGTLWTGHASPGKVPTADLLRIDEAKARDYVELATQVGHVHGLSAGEWSRKWSRGWYGTAGAPVHWRRLRSAGDRAEDDRRGLGLHLGRPMTTRYASSTTGRATP